MINFKSVIKFVTLFVIAYIILLIPQTKINKVYQELFCVIGNKLFHHFPNDGTTVLKIKSSEEKSFVSVASTPKVKPFEKTYIRKFTINTYSTGFLHTIFFLSLVIATQLSWKRKIIALSIGFFIITCFVMLKVRLMILYVDATSAIFGVTNPPTITPYSFWYKYFAEPMTPGYSFAIILWLCVSIGKKEWLQLNGIISQMISNNKIKQKKQVYQTNIPQGKDKQQKNIPQHVKIKNTSISSHGEKKSGME